MPLRANLQTVDLVLRLVLAAIFLAASVDKILHPAAFAVIVRDYRILPEFLINPTALLLPWLEAVLGVLLVLGLWREGTLLLVNGLLLTFWATLVLNYFRGIDVNCGCFSTTPGQTGNMLWYLVRDSFFLLLGFASTLVYARRQARG